ncbi:MAG: putative 2OG-Fe(II) oxygenase [bacterium]
MFPDPEPPSYLQCLELEHAETINTPLLKSFLDSDAGDAFRRSHYFGGRYENLYLAQDRIPEIQPVLDAALMAVSQQIGEPPAKIKAGFWFNKMLPGEETTLHSHDDLDERVSGVYYVKVPENSGNLVLLMPSDEDKEDTVETVIEPAAGKLVLFSPETPHYVTRNLSHEMRLSIGMNFGTGDFSLPYARP